MIWPMPHQWTSRAWLHTHRKWSKQCAKKSAHCYTNCNRLRKRLSCWKMIAMKKRRFAHFSLSFFASSFFVWCSIPHFDVWLIIASWDVSYANSFFLLFFSFLSRLWFSKLNFYKTRTSSSKRIKWRALAYIISHHGTRVKKRFLF